MNPQNEDKIKVLEKALDILRIEISLNTGICDVINQSVNRFEFLPAIFREPKFYGIILPPAKRRYYPQIKKALFCYPCTLEGRQQRIEVLEEAINKLKNHE